MLLRKQTTNTFVALYLILLHLFLTNVVFTTRKSAMIVNTKLQTKPRYKLALKSSFNSRKRFQSTFQDVG